MPKMSKDSIEKAQRALKVFRGMQPTLNAYARMLTGRRDIRVEADTASNGSTDGKKIYYRPPISLGEDVQHKGWMCNRRDALKQLACPACHQRESVLSTIYHEIAHIWFDSFQPMTEDAKATAIRQSIFEHGSKFAEGLEQVLETRSNRIGYMELAGLISPFMPMLLNALEDARVNRELFKALPGTKVMFDANTVCIFDKGVEQLGEDGEWINDKWSERPLNMQAIIGVFCMASGYDFTDWLNEFVVKSLADATLVDLVQKINKLDRRDSVDATFSLAFPVLARLRELGFLRSDEDPEDDFTPPYEEEPEPSEEDEADDKSDTGTAADDSTADDSEEADDSPGDGAAEPADSGEEGDSSGDDSVRSDDDDDSGDTAPSDGSDDAVDKEGEVGEDETGGDPSGGSSDGPEADSESPDRSTGEPGTDPGDSDAGSDSGEEVPEADSGASPAGTVDTFSPGDSDGVRDGEGPGGELDGPDRTDLGDESSDESGDSADAVGVSGERTRLEESRGDTGDSEGELVDAATENDDEPSDEEALDVKGGERSIRVEGEIDRPVKPRDVDWGTADDIRPEVMELGNHETPHTVEVGHTHEHPHEHKSPEDEAGDEVVKAVMVSGLYFEMPSQQVTSVNIHTEATGVFDQFRRFDSTTRRRFGAEGEVRPSEQLIAPALLRARVVFAANFRGRREIGLRSGRVHGPSLGRRAPVGDDRLFQRKSRPGRDDYFVGIGIDCSGSTAGVNILLAKQVAFAEAEVLSRLGIPFFMYGHTGEWGTGVGGGMSLEMIEIKNADEPWNDTTRNRLESIGPYSANLDGHTIQFYRKMLEKQRATKKILHYYSDGSMPCENHDEELQILREEIMRFRKAGIVLPCVGIRTDAPKQHGLHTVRVNTQSDVLAVVNDLEKHLTRHG